jgi:hypothetical protein
VGKQLYRRLPQAFVADTLAAFNDHRMTERQACALLGLRRARLYELRREWLRQRGRWALAAPRRSRRRWPAEITSWLHQECQYLRDDAEQYRGRFNFAVLAEAAHRQFGRTLSRSGVRRWAIRQGYYQQTRGEVRKVYIRWESVGPGALWHHDTSHHCWLPRRGGYQDLILTQDDYSRRIVAWRLEVQERLWDHLCLVREAVERWGRPLAYYVDEHGYFRYVARASAWRQERLRTDEGEIQFRRILQRLDVGVIYSYSPQARGKIEKRFDYFQRRLPQLCERYRITELQPAATILEDLIGYYNEQRRHQDTGEIPAARWTTGIRQGRGRLRPLPAELDLPLLFAVHHERKVHSDGKVRFLGRPWAVSAPPGSWVTVCWRPAEQLVMLWQNQRVGAYALEGGVQF